MKRYQRLCMLMCGTLLLLDQAIAQQEMEQSNPFKEDSIRIKGTIAGYQPGQTESYVKFSVCDPDGTSNRIAVAIQPDGSFDAVLARPVKGDIGLNYKEAYISVYAEPGKELSVAIDEKQMDFGKPNSNVFLVAGELAGISNAMIRFQSEFNQHPFLLKADAGYKEQSETTFALNRQAQLKEELQFFEAYVLKKRVGNQTFVVWQRNHLIYSAAKDIMYFAGSAKPKFEISVPQLYQLLDQIPVNSLTAWNNSAYYEFLSLLSATQMILINMNPMYDDLKKNNGFNTLTLRLNHIDQIAKGLTRQLLYADNYFSAEQAGMSRGRMDSTVHNVYLKKRMIEKDNAADHVFKPYPVLEKIKSSNASIPVKKKLADIFMKTRGSNLYLDFWGDWCAPCMQEMPNYPKLIQALKHKPIRFIFFAVRTTEDQMHHVQEKFKINADFIYLSNDEATVMNTILGFHAYPSHFLIDAAGMLVDTNPGYLAEAERVGPVTDAINRRFKW
ncbi:TlpA family protein disulfide reductase [Pedobacter metabolipauper]|uniref:Thiol-disulfide isomerase/thioredoxin n=1 Tax=Pedobacter metabolipauper TaxID=425513 RepID=A0A4R6SWL4_9SPHI|nr:TlpA disulfide reductase family protein [Pedobacter metabolipauper]TDQ08791.1 thiol-disulfide isomerase/thioredoxin [Pedobacter metabolipauper]